MFAVSDFDIVTRHCNDQFRSITQLWHSSDSLERFEKNCNDLKKQAILERSGWMDPDCISYKFNSFGFRDEEFDDRPAGLALGCSHTQGVGLPESVVWPRILSSVTGTHIWNLGVAGSGIDTAFRLLDHWLPKINPKFVVFCVPSRSRVEIFDRGMPVSLFPEFVPAHLEGFYKHWAIDETNAKILKRKNLLAMQYLCDRTNITFRYLDHSELWKLDNNCRPGWARDLMHCGVEQQTMFAQKMYAVL